MKKTILLFTILSVIFLSGCNKREDMVTNALDSYIENSIMDSQIEKTESYQKYEDDLLTNDVNEDGFYESDQVDYSVVEDGDAIHVTFFKNSFIEIEYYNNPSYTDELNPKGVFLHEGDSIYANIVEVDNPNTSAYKFSSFEIWEFDKDGKKKKKIDAEPYADGLVFTIPEGFAGKELAIVPLGEFEARTITFRAFYKDNNSEEWEADGEWEIDGLPVEDNAASVNSVASYTVKFLYDPEVYEVVSSEPKFLNDDKEGIVSFEEISSNQKVDSITIELKPVSSNVVFDPKKYQTLHGKVTYKYDGRTIENEIEIPSGAEIEYEIIADDGYRVTVANPGKIAVDRIQKHIKNAISTNEMVKVLLPQPKRGGKVKYSIDGDLKKESSVTVIDGTEITMEFAPKNGWTCIAGESSTYKSGKASTQTANVDGKTIDAIFVESEEYKPNVTVMLDKSVGLYTEFTLEAEGIDNTFKLENEKKDQTIYEGKISTIKDLIISTSGGGLLDGKALRLDIEKIDSDGNKIIDIQYMAKVPENIKIDLYGSGSIVYTGVKIKISRVDASRFSPTEMSNATISVKTADLTQNRYIKKGDLIEASRQVEMIITPKYGYYIKDSGDKTEYSTKMKYSKYESNKLDIAEKHPAKKKCVVVLDDSDAYGNVTYRINGKVSGAGKYELKEEDKLEISYKITNTVYVISRSSDNWIGQAWDFVKSKTNETSETVEIDITSAIDGTTIKRENYIRIEKK